MIAVIFRAQVAYRDNEYFKTAASLRALALEQFGCLGFHAVSEGGQEISISYWPDEDSIRAWNAHPEHIQAQKRGKERWYASYTIQIANVCKCIDWDEREPQR